MPKNAMDIRPLSDDEMKTVSGGVVSDPMHDVPRDVSPALDAVLNGYYHTCGCVSGHSANWHG